MVVSKTEQIAMRRARVLELSSQGLTQQEIAERLVTVSQRTVCNDLIWWKNESIDFVKRNKEELAFEYRRVMSNFYQLRKEAWKHFHSTQNENIKSDLYGIIGSINIHLVNLMAVGDMISLELSLGKSKNEATAIKQDMRDLIDLQNNNNKSEAVF